MMIRRKMKRGKNMQEDFLSPFALSPLALTKNHLAQEIIKCNEFTESHGLALSLEQAYDLIETKNAALKHTGRIDFESGTINRIIREFCDCRYISRSDYAEILNSLVEIFYYFKNETMDLVSDEDLISIMRKYFDESCMGSIDLLQSRELESLARKIKNNVQNWISANRYDKYDNKHSDKYDDGHGDEYDEHGDEYDENCED